MTYQAIGELLFPLYISGCGIALFGALRSFRQTLLVLAYAFIPIIMFQLSFDGMAQLFRWKWYLLVSGTEIYIILLAVLSEVRATKYLVVLALCSILVNLTYLPFYISGHPLPRHLYFLSVAGIQILQIGSLIVFAPMWPFLMGLVRKQKRRGESPWMHRIPSGIQ